MTDITAETPAGEVWGHACGVYEQGYDETPGPIGARSRVVAGDQAAAAILQQAFDARDAAKDARIAELEVEVGRLREALNVEWANATRMRNASKLVGPYPNDRAKNQLWVRALYHEGKAAHERMKSFRAGGSHDQ